MSRKSMHARKCGQCDSKCPSGVVQRVLCTTECNLVSESLSPPNTYFRTQEQILLGAQLWWSANCRAAAAQATVQHRCSSISNSNCKIYICAELCSICISLGVSGVAETLMPK